MHRRRQSRRSTWWLGPRNFTSGRLYLKAALQDPVLAVLEDDLLNLEIDPVKVPVFAVEPGGVIHGPSRRSRGRDPDMAAGAAAPQVFQGLSPQERLMMGLGDVLGPADGTDLASHPAMKQRMSQGTAFAPLSPPRPPQRRERDSRLRRWRLH